MGSGITNVVAVADIVDEKDLERVEVPVSVRVAVTGVIDEVALGEPLADGETLLLASTDAVRLVLADAVGERVPDTLLLNDLDDDFVTETDLLLDGVSLAVCDIVREAERVAEIVEL